MAANCRQVSLLLCALQNTVLARAVAIGEQWCIDAVQIAGRPASQSPIERDQLNGRELSEWMNEVNEVNACQLQWPGTGRWMALLMLMLEKRAKSRCFIATGHWWVTTTTTTTPERLETDKEKLGRHGFYRGMDWRRWWWWSSSTTVNNPRQTHRWADKCADKQAIIMAIGCSSNYKDADGHLLLLLLATTTAFNKKHIHSTWLLPLIARVCFVHLLNRMRSQ